MRFRSALPFLLLIIFLACGSQSAWGEQASELSQEEQKAAQELKDKEAEERRKKKEAEEKRREEIAENIPPVLHFRIGVDKDPSPDDIEMRVEDTNKVVYVSKEIFMTSDEFIQAKAVNSKKGGLILQFTVPPELADKMMNVTGENLNNRFCVLVDEKLITAPTIRQEMDNSGVYHLAIRNHNIKQLAERIRLSLIKTQDEAQDTVEEHKREVASEQAKEKDQKMEEEKAQ